MTLAQTNRVGRRAFGSWSWSMIDGTVTLTERTAGGDSLPVLVMENVDSQWITPDTGPGLLHIATPPAFVGAITWTVVHRAV